MRHIRDTILGAEKSRFFAQDLDEIPNGEMMMAMKSLKAAGERDGFRLWKDMANLR